MRALPELVDRPSNGRTFTGTRTVSLADVAPDGRMRFDAIARFLGDVGNDDTDDAGFAELGLAWVARRATILVRQFPISRDHLAMTTWCSGTGKRWAERRTSITSESGAHVEAAALWIHLDPATGRPAAWGDEFAATYLDAAGGREVGSRLSLSKSPDPDAESNQMPWQFRRADLDVFDHVNNAAYLAVLEEALGSGVPPTPLRVDVEWHRPVGAGVELTVTEQFGPTGMQMWIQDDSGTVAVIAGAPLAE
jgi:acyl-ACP thioesterase